MIKKMYGAERIKTTIKNVFKAMIPDLTSQITKSQNGIDIIMPQKIPRCITDKYPPKQGWSG